MSENKYRKGKDEIGPWPRDPHLRGEKDIIGVKQIESCKLKADSDLTVNVVPFV